MEHLPYCLVGFLQGQLKKTGAIEKHVFNRQQQIELDKKIPYFVQSASIQT